MIDILASSVRSLLHPLSTDDYTETVNFSKRTIEALKNIEEYEAQKEIRQNEIELEDGLSKRIKEGLVESERTRIVYRYNEGVLEINREGYEVRAVILHTGR